MMLPFKEAINHNVVLETCYMYLCQQQNYLIEINGKSVIQQQTTWDPLLKQKRRQQRIKNNVDYNDNDDGNNKVRGIWGVK